MQILWRIIQRAAKYRASLFWAYVSVFGVTGFSLVIPWLLGMAIDAILHEGERVSWDVSQLLLIIALGVLMFSVLRGVFAFGQAYLGEAISQKVAYDLRNEFYDHLQQLSFAFHDKEQTGNLMSKATADVEAIRMFIQTGVIRSIYMATLILGVGILMLMLNWKLAILSLVFVPIVGWRGIYLIRRLRREWLAVQDEMGHMTTVLQENLSGQRVVKAFAAEDHERDKFYYRAAKVSEHSYKASVYQASNSGMMTFCHVGIMVLNLWVGGWMIIDPDQILTTGDLAQFIFYLGLLAMPVRMAAWIVNSFARALPAAQRIFATLDVKSLVEERENALELSGIRGHVRLEAVSFGYTSSTPVLHQIDLEAKPADVVALIGASGSGKSTIAHLIPRFYDVTDGRITIDGIDVRDVTLTSLRSSIGVIQQDVFLFTSTIRDNIAYGASGASLDQVINASKVAQLHDFIMSLPDGYNTWVGERGITLSGGQRQRLAIARTVLLDPPILILDDSTSSVDTETEHLIRKAMVDVMKGRTTFVIGHRLSSVKSADTIVVLKGGRVVQEGNHKELLQQQGLYREIYELQLQSQEAILDDPMSLTSSNDYPWTGATKFRMEEDV
jgi:ABC-type multidrug transport system fused ATPase/permease subunit